MLSVPRNLHVPVTPVAGNVPQIPVLAVGGSKENALPRMRRCPSAECGAIDIVLSGEEGAQRLHLGFAKSRQLTDLQNPIALQFLGGGLVLGIAQVQAVREPFPGKAGDKSAFADALGTVQDQHGIELHTRLLHPAHGGAEGR